MLEKLGKWAKEDKNSKYMWLVMGLIVLVLGITFWPMGNPKETKIPAVVTQTTVKESQSYEEALEKKLANILSKMEGVGEVNVMVTIVSNEEKVLAEDTTTSMQRTEEKDQAGGTRVSDTDNTTQKIVLQDGNTPYVIKQNAPVIKGVLILAQGAGNSGVRESVTNAVASLLDVPVHKISVEKRK